MKKIFWWAIGVVIVTGVIIAVGFLVWQSGQNKDAGLVDGEREVRQADGEAELRKIKLYFYNPENDKDEAGDVKCGRDGLVAVEREIPVSKTPIQEAINLLLEGGLNQVEREAGITTEFPLAGVELKGVNLQDGVLTLEFADPGNKTSGGACRAGILWFQIEATAKQFEDVAEVRFTPETLFQP